MVSVESWKKHFRRMAHKSFPSEDMYLVGQSGRGLGRNSYNRTTYKIRGSSPTKSDKSTIEIVSPVAQELERAKVLIGPKSIKGKGSGKKCSKKSGRCTGKVKKKKSTKGKSTAKKGKKTNKKKTGGKKKK